MTHLPVHILENDLGNTKIHQNFSNSVFNCTRCVTVSEAIALHLSYGILPIKEWSSLSKKTTKWCDSRQGLELPTAKNRMHTYPRFLLNEEQELFCRDPNPSFRYNDYGLFSPQHYLNPTHENENLINRVPNEEEMHLFHGSGDTLRNFDKHQGHDFDYGWISQYHPVSQTGHYEYDEHLRPWLDITNNFQNFQPTPNQSHFFYPSSSMPSANFFDVHQSNILPDGKQIRLTGSDQQSHNSFKDYNFASEIPSITTGFQPPSKGFLEKNQSQNLLSERESHQMDPLQLKKSFESTDYLPSAKDMIYKEIHQPHKFQSGGSYNSGYLPTNLNNFKHDVFNVANTGLNENYFQNGLQSDQPLDLDSANMFLNCECNDPSEKSSARICNSDTDATERGF
ncbi:hypothetical protein BY996DRAFT_6489766 [Phakopsora pachyrhizi]|nr:hypothetical protein BY996DRAFT_6489766 [Phakopsora pachyrhizi]